MKDIEIKKRVRNNINLFGKKETLEERILSFKKFDVVFKTYENNDYIGYLEIYPNRYSFKIVRKKDNNTLLEAVVKREFYDENIDYFKIIEKYFKKIVDKYFM